MSEDTAMDKKIDAKEQLALEALPKKLIEKKEKSILILGLWVSFLFNLNILRKSSKEKES